MRTKRNIPDYSTVAWRTVTGEDIYWRDLDDRHLANIYGYFYVNTHRYRTFSDSFPFALEWLQQEAERRGISYMLDAVIKYGPYPYFDTNNGAWMIYDRQNGFVPLYHYVQDYGMKLLPPDVRDEVRVRFLLTSDKKIRRGRVRSC